MNSLLSACCLVLVILTSYCTAQIAPKDSYLSGIKQELETVWPKNRRINLVFHGHSVPGGSWNDHRVETLQSYPHLTLEALKARYPYAVINVIITAVGGENSVQGAARFEAEVLNHKPDVLFIDYALNDRGVGLEKAEKAWRHMIEAAQKAGTRIILLTPTPDQRVDMLATGNALEQHADLVRKLAAEYKTGLADSYAIFLRKLKETGSIKPYMSWVNHPNKDGHQIVANEIITYF